MTPRNRHDDGGLIGGGSAAVVRAIGSLLVALSGSDERTRHLADDAVPRVARARPSGAPPDRSPAPGGSSDGGWRQDDDDRRLLRGTAHSAADRLPPRAEPPGVPGDDTARFEVPDLGGDDEIEWLLADARARASQILDESMEQARCLMEERGALDSRALTDLRRTVHGLVQQIADVRRRLIRIEALIEEQGAPARRVREEPGAPPAAAPVAAPVTPAASPPPSTMPPAAAPAAGQATRPARSLNLVPPVAASTPEDADAPPSPQPLPRQAAAIPGASSDGAAPAAGREPPAMTPGPVFSPEQGALVIRAGPVAGFQGLMRVQEALGRIDVVRQATVEAYAQGEARLRLELARPATAEALAAGLEQHLGEPARVWEQSERDRSVLIAIG